MRTCLALFLLTATSLFADTLTYNFENQLVQTSSISPNSHPGLLLSVTQTSGTVALVVTRQNADTFDLVDLSSYVPTWGHYTLDPFHDETAAADAFVFTFSQAIYSFSVQVGDFGLDSDTETLAAYSGAAGTGSLIASATGNWGTQDLSANPPQTDTISSATPFTSVLVTGGSVQDPNSLYFDNVVASTTPVPEPAPVLLLLPAAIALTWIGIRRARQA